MSEAKAPRLVLHIGPHKTATSYLQYNFHSQRAELARRGWLYPETGERVRTAHHDISDQRKSLMPEGSAAARDLRSIGAEARARGLDILLSSEGFRHFRLPQYKRLLELLGVTEFRVAYTLRDPLDHFYANWAQTVRNGHGKPLDEVVSQHFAKPAASVLLNPALELGPPISGLKADATLLLYDRIMAQGLDIFTVFCEQALGISGLSPSSATPRNARMPIELTEFLRALAPLAELKVEKTSVKLGAAFEWFVRPREREAIVATMVKEAQEARREIRVDRTESGLVAIERQLIASYGRFMFPALPAPDRLYDRDEAVWVHYDAEALRSNPAVRRHMDRVLRRVGQSSLPMRIAGATYAVLIGFRRWRKRIRG